MGLSWQQGPLGRNPNGRFLAPGMPERTPFAEPLRRRMRVELGGAPPEHATLLRDTVAFAWRAIDAFHEEDERILGHAADPYHRIDIRRTSRHLVVRDGDEVVADTHAPLVLYESGFAPRGPISRRSATWSGSAGSCRSSPIASTSRSTVRGSSRRPGRSSSRTGSTAT